MRGMMTTLKTQRIYDTTVRRVRIIAMLLDNTGEFESFEVQLNRVLNEFERLQQIDEQRESKIGEDNAAEVI